MDGETAAGSWPRFLSAETADSAIQILTGAFTSVLSSGARLQAAQIAQIAQIAIAPSRVGYQDEDILASRGMPESMDVL